MLIMVGQAEEPWWMIFDDNGNQGVGDSGCLNT